MIDDAKGQLNELALFAGAGGGILGGTLLGWRTKCAVEINPYCRSVLLARQRDGILPRFPIWDDVRTFDGKPWRGQVDVISGGFPCQDISCAGKGAGIEGSRSGLWVEMARIVHEVRPRFVFVENSPMLTSRGLGYVLGDLATMGYDARWGVLGADNVGAPHRRKRIWIVANASSGRCCRSCKREIQQSRRAEVISSSKMADATRIHAQGQYRGQGEGQSGGEGWWDTEPDVGRVADGVASRVDRLKALGNGQVPTVAALAWKVLND